MDIIESIGEAAKAKAMLESFVMAMVKTFEEETGLVVMAIDLGTNSIRTHGQPTEYIHAISSDVRLR